MPVSKNRRKPAKSPAKAGNAPQKSASRSLYVTGVIAAALIGGAAYWLVGRGDGTQVSVSVPTLTGTAIKGEQIFNANCGSCHGKNAAGSDNGPPLVHKIYEPSHHGDRAFFVAAGRGVRAHHWRFGDMPAVRGMSTQDIQSIVAYVRALQIENGIR